MYLRATGATGFPDTQYLEVIMELPNITLEFRNNALLNIMACTKFWNRLSEKKRHVGKFINTKLALHKKGSSLVITFIYLFLKF